MSKLVSIYAKIDPKLKEQVEIILSTLGLSTSVAIEIFFRQIVLNKKLPFEKNFLMKNLFLLMI